MERSMATWARWCSGKNESTRCRVCEASMVCNDAKIRCPVSAACMATATLSASRSSPSTITSGLWRSTSLSAVKNDGVSPPTSRWVRRLLRSRCTNSMGSSIVTMCAARVLLMRCTMAAKVVLLPLPVAPTTSTMPRSSSARRPKPSWSPSSPSSSSPEGKARATNPKRPCRRCRLMR